MTFKLKELALPQGSTIMCCHCHEPILVVLRNIYQGEKLNANLFKPVKQDISNGEAMVCPYCGKGIMMYGKFLTKELGFLPNYSN